MFLLNSNIPCYSNFSVPSEVENISVTNITTEEAVIVWSNALGDVDGYDLFLNPKEGVECDPCPREITGTTHFFKGISDFFSELSVSSVDEF